MQNVFVEIREGGVCGRGEASPNAFYAESAEEVARRLRAAAPFVKGLQIAGVADIGRAWREAWAYLSPSRAAQCALDLALWDWLARRRGISVAELALGRPARPVWTFCTVGISDEKELARKAEELRGFPLVKVKSDVQADLAAAAFLRERTGAALAVDANCAWEGADLAALSRELERLGGLFIEQPLPPALDDAMPELLAVSALPILADESCVGMEDVERMPGRFSGFNVKLVKCGGLTPALAMLRRGRELGLRTMVGCMLESSLLIAAGMVAAQESDYADLDGAWLLRDDPFRGIYLARGVLTTGSSPGFGVELRAI